MNVLLVSFHNVDNWCKYVRDRLHAASKVAVVSDKRNDGDISLTDRFYTHLKISDCIGGANKELGPGAIDDIIARCRTLRDLDRSLAHRMIGAMALSVASVYSEWQPTIILSPTIDRYVFDVMARVAESRGIRFIEMTTSLVPEHVLFMRRGCMIPIRAPHQKEFDRFLPTLSNLNWAPSYVDQTSAFTLKRYWKTVLHFHLRGHYMNVERWLMRDPLNVRYLEALPWRKHRARLGDNRVLATYDAEWFGILKSTPQEKRVFLGLQVFPESSIDYWIRDRRMIDHDGVLLRVVRKLTRAGYRIFVKDHPNQFGFRLYSQIAPLAAEEGTVMVPYHVPGALLMFECKYTLTLTGTIGFQAAMNARIPIVIDPYYAVKDSLFIKMTDYESIETLPEKLRNHRQPSDLRNAKRELMHPLLASSVPGNYYSCFKFNCSSKRDIEATAPFLASLNTYLPFLSRVNIHALSPGAPDPAMTH